MMKLGIHYGLSMPEYLAIPAVSNGVLQTLLERCPAAAWFCSPFNPNRPRDDNDASDAGTIAHAILLEGTRDCLAVIDPKDHPAETKPFAIPQGFTNKSIRAARDAARAAGKIPVLPSDVAAIDALVGAAERFIVSLQKEEPNVYAAFMDDGGKSEVTFVWQEGPTLCKARADRIAADHSIIIDYKSTATSVQPDAWSRTMLDYMGAAWYRRGVKAVTGVEPDYLFLAGERDPPHLHALIGVNPADLALGEEKIAVALRDWQRRESANHWPGYPARTVYPDIPPWHRAQWMERNGGDGLPADLSTIFKREAA
jgi:hypothetical protein